MTSIYSITEIGKKIIAIRFGICNIATLNKHPLIDFPYCLLPGWRNW